MSKDKCLNVSMIQCFWCGKPKGIAIGKELIGCKNKYDTKYTFDSYEPCDKCKEQWDKNFVLIEVQEEPMQEEQPEIRKGIYPTGSLWIITKEAAIDIFDKKVVDEDMAFISKDMAELLGLYEN